jgi:hypothetical protein
MFPTGLGCVCVLGEGSASATAIAGFAESSFDFGVGVPAASRSFAFRSGLAFSRFEDSVFAGGVGALSTESSGTGESLG